MPMRLLYLLLVLFMIIPVSISALHFARWDTSMGTFTAEIYDQIVPITANNFINLANSGFYNNLIFHRVVSGFVIQDGCPYGTGYGGPGYTIPDEFSPLLHHDQAGILAMARTSAPNSAGSQYYITLAPTPHLDGNYAIFGKVIEGLDNVMSIGSVPVNANNLPLTPVNIFSLQILDLIIGEIMPVDNQIIAEPGIPLLFYIEAYASNSPLVYQWYVDGELQMNPLDFLFEYEFDGIENHIVRCIVSSDDYQHEVVWYVNAPSEVQSNLQQIAAINTLKVYPNPSYKDVNIVIDSSKAEVQDIGIYNIKGQKLHTFFPPVASQGISSYSWNGLDIAGDSLPSGIYFVRVRTGNSDLTRKFLRLRR